MKMLLVAIFFASYSACLPYLRLAIVVLLLLYMQQLKQSKVTCKRLLIVLQMTILLQEWLTCHIVSPPFAYPTFVLCALAMVICHLSEISALIYAWEIHTCDGEFVTLTR